MHQQLPVWVLQVNVAPQRGQLLLLGALLSGFIFMLDNGSGASWDATKIAAAALFFDINLSLVPKEILA